MDPSRALVLYVALPVIDKDVVLSHYGYIPFRLATSNKFYVGLRENADDAIERFKQHKYFADHRKGSYVLFQVTFSAAGLAHYVTKSAGPEYNHSAILAKQTYWKDLIDYGVWHFQGDLPLQASDEQGVLLVSCEVLSVGGEADQQM